MPGQNKGVDGRNKSGHDERPVHSQLMRAWRRIRAKGR